MLFDIARKFLFLSPGAAKVPIHSDLKQTKKGGIGSSPKYHRK